MIALPRLAPSRGLPAMAGQVWGTTRAEIAMQWRRWGLWVAYGCVTSLLALLTAQAAIYLLHVPPTSLYAQLRFTPAEMDNVMIYGGTGYGVMIFGAVAALLVVDRIERDRRLGISELQRAAHQGHARYVLGKFLGGYVAVLAPMLLGYLLCALITIPLGWSVTLLPRFLLAFLLVFVPSSVAAVGVTFLLSSFLPVRVVQIAFPVLWLEFSIGIGWHGLATSLFNPSGLYAYLVFFPVRLPSILGDQEPTLTLALLNIATLLLTAVIALFLTCVSLAIQQRRAEGA